MTAPRVPKGIRRLLGLFTSRFKEDRSNIERVVIFEGSSELIDFRKNGGNTLIMHAGGQCIRFSLRT
jgi:hypothetical protein